MENEGLRSQSHMQMLGAFALLGYRVYGGTVPKATVAKRRAKNKVARRSRRVNRG